MQPPIYPPEAVKPFREELNVVGLKDLLTPEEVDQALSAKGTALVVINSICGCAAGAARPAVGLALQNKVIPDQLFTVFAGMERAAVARVRARHREAAAPSSPSIALFKDGKIVAMMPRSDIEGRTAQELAGELVAAFNAHCARPGPSIPADRFSKLRHIQACGSSIPRMGE